MRGGSYAGLYFSLLLLLICILLNFLDVYLGSVGVLSSGRT